MEKITDTWYWISDLAGLNMWWWLSGLLVVTMVLVYVYVWLKENLPLIALKERPRLFGTVKKGKTILIKTAGKIMGGANGYYSNLPDLNKHADRITGKMMPGRDEELENSFWWKRFGVIWMGFGGSIHEYWYEKMDVVNGKIVPIKTMAGSIWDKNSLVVQVRAKSEELYDIEFDLQLILETTHGGLSLNYDDLNGFTGGKVKSACRDFCAITAVRAINKQQLEKDGELFKDIMAQNSDVGNESLEKQVGQRITNVSMISPIRIVDKDIEKALESERVAEQAMLGKIKDAEASAAVLKKQADAQAYVVTTEAAAEASATERNGIAAANAVGKMVKEIGKKYTTELKRTCAIATAIEKHKGTLALGGMGGIVLGDSDIKNPEGNKKKDGK